MRFDAKGMDMSIRTLETAALLITGSLVAVASSAPMGPPTAYLGAGRWGVGAEYGYGQMDLETSGTVTDEVARACRRPTCGIRISGSTTSRAT